MDAGDTKRIVLLGKTGAGKSSLANTILGEKDVFKESALANSETRRCQAKKKKVYERNIRLVDTPGLFDTDLNSSELTSEILRCIEECAPGPHAFLIVLKVERYTKHEQEVVDTILKYFSKDALKYTTVVFTCGDNLPEGMTIEDWVNENEALMNLVDKCGGRCHVFDNKSWNNSQDQYRNNQVQVKELLETIENTVRENGGGYYTNTFLKMVMCNLKRLWSRFKNVSAGVLLGALLGAKAIAAALFETNPSTPSPEEEEVTGPSQNVQETDIMRIVLLGKTGSGKSSLANTIFRERDIFEISHSCFGTQLCQSETRTVNGRSIHLIDTPGVFNTDSNSPGILRCITECAPGLHVFLIVLRVERYTEHEQAVVDEILKYFSKEALKYTTVVFTNGDYVSEGMSIKDWVNETEALRNLVDKCGGRCHVFDNKYWNNSQDQYRNNQVQVKELLQTIENTVRENGGKYYTNKTLQNVEKQIQKEMVCIRESSENMSEEEIRETAKTRLTTKLVDNYNFTGSAFLDAVMAVGYGIAKLFFR